MSTFDKDPSFAAQPTPESYENQSHVINRSRVEVDLSQPDRAKDFPLEGFTGFKESKLIAEIITPKDAIGVIYTKLGDFDPVLTLAGKEPDAVAYLHPGDERDLSDLGEKNKCLITFDDSGEHLYIHARDVDTRYQLFTRELEQYKVPEAPLDDPES